MDLIIPGKDGKPQFVGQEDPNNPPTTPPGGSKMICPVCGGEFDYLLGEDMGGGRMGCEKDWLPPTDDVRQSDKYDKSKEIL